MNSYYHLYPCFYNFLSPVVVVAAAVFTCSPGLTLGVVSVFLKAALICFLTHIFNLALTAFVTAGVFFFFPPQLLLLYLIDVYFRALT